MVEWKSTDRGLLFGSSSMADAAATLLGLDRLGAELVRITGAERLFLDGLLSVWQPDPSAVGD